MADLSSNVLPETNKSEHSLEQIFGVFVFHLVGGHAMNFKCAFLSAQPLCVQQWNNVIHDCRFLLFLLCGNDYHQSSVLYLVQF